jgi:hypothetical protein
MAVDRDPYDRTNPNAPLGTGMGPGLGTDRTSLDRTDMTDATYGARRGNGWAWGIGALVVLLALFALFNWSGSGGRDVNTTATTTSRPAGSGTTGSTTGAGTGAATTAPSTPAAPATPARPATPQ